ncbi:MAG: PPE family protein [Mycobacterium sp.]
MDFAAMPPELTSGLMYAGPGAESMLAAATAWEGLATELASAANSYGSVVSGLTGESWAGASAAAMASAVTPLVSWLSTAASQASATGVQAKAATSAYEAAFAAVVPPPVIAANRSRLVSLLAANTFGQNTTAIAATEAAYAQMWAQDAAAMYGYATAAAAATRLPAFAAPSQATDPAGQTSQAGAAGATAGNGVISQLLQNLGVQGIGAAGAQAGSQAAGSSALASLQAIYESLFASAGSVLKFEGIANAAMSMPNLGMVMFKTNYKPLDLLPDIPKSALGAGLGGPGLSALGSGAGSRLPASGGLIRAVAATVGEAPSVGALSVPQGWATATPAIRLAATSLPAAIATAAPAAGVLDPAALGSLTGGALGVGGSRLISATSTGSVGGVHGGRAGRNAPVQLDRVIAQLQKQKDSVQHWQIDEANLDDLLEELSKKPGFHAVHLTKGRKGEAAPANSTSG